MSFRQIKKIKDRGSYEALFICIDKVTINAINWYNKTVHLMSTFCKAESIDVVKKWNRKIEI